MTSTAVLLARAQDPAEPCGARTQAAVELAEITDESQADELLALASNHDLPIEVQLATGASLAKVFFRLGRHMDLFALRDLSDAAFEAFDDTIAELLTLPA